LATIPEFERAVLEVGQAWPSTAHMLAAVLDEMKIAPTWKSAPDVPELALYPANTAP
jgi:hypothetical protein